MTRSMSRRVIYLGLLLSVLALTGCPLLIAPLLSVSPITLSFGTGGTVDTLTIVNNGGGTLTWSFQGAPSWLTITPLSGSTTTETDEVTLTANRTGLAPGDYQADFEVTSNGGTQTIAASMRILAPPSPPILSVLPTTVAFLPGDTTKTFDIRNTGSGTLSWNITESLNWVTLSAITGTTTSETDTITVTIDRTGQIPGPLTGTISITSNGGNQDVTLSATVPGPTPDLVVNPLSFDFSTNRTLDTFTIRNDGSGTLNWTITDDADWLTLSATAGDTTTEIETITATVDRTGLDAGTYTGQITVSSDGGTEVIQVSMVVAATQLVVTPLSIDFGVAMVRKLIIIGNGGIGVVNWNLTIDTLGAPAFLSVDKVSGSVSTEPEPVQVTVDRSGLAPGEYNAKIVVTSNAGTVEVQVHVEVAAAPILTVIGNIAEEGRENELSFGAEDTTAQFTVMNAGQGTLSWSINTTNFPEDAPWLVGMNPTSGTLDAGESVLVTATANREGLSAGSKRIDVVISSYSNSVVLEVTLLVEKKVIIGASPVEVDFGLESDTGEFFVANIGDAGTILQFQVEADKSWLFRSPERGTSVGVPGPIKDFKEVNLSVDRSALGTTGATGLVTVRALDGQGEIIEDIAAVTVLVSVQAAPLSFEATQARLRIPSLVRYILLMRDIGDRAIAATPTDLADAFDIFERSVFLEASETNQFVVSGDNLRTHLILLLDYSGSMFEAADGINVPDSHHLQFVYEQNVIPFLNNLPSHYLVSLMEMHDRDQGGRVRQTFTTDRAALAAAVQNLRTSITDFGATELLPTAEDAADQFLLKDFPLIPFDDADVRALVFVSDGRLTTPPGQLRDTTDYLLARKVRVYGVGWGLDVNNEPLARLSSLSGGHYYPSRPDSAGLPVRERMGEALDRVRSDLESQVVLGYVTLNEEPSTPIRINAAFDNPADNQNTPPNNEIIQGSFEQIHDLDTILGDVRMGQISMRSAGISNGAAEVVVRGEYIPRNINRFRLTLSSTEQFNVDTVGAANGGIVEDWSINPPAQGGNSYTFDLTPPTPGTVLPYGIFGDLVVLTFPSVAGTFTVNLTVDNDTYLADPETKYFVYPDTIDVDADGALFPAFPTPSVSPLTIALGSSTTPVTINIRNIGGSYPYSGGPIASSSVALYWRVSSAPDFVDPPPPTPLPSGVQGTTSGSDSFQIVLDPTKDPGNKVGIVTIEWRTIPFGLETGPVDVGGVVSVPVTATIQNPVLSVTPTVLNLDTTTATGTITVRNLGQSTLNWFINDLSFPDWLAATPLTGASTTKPTTVEVNLIVADLPLGDSSFTFRVASSYGTADVQVNASNP
ncbi:MAG: hypothetical protein HY706_01665 [Candidatus Hydrogenedentes bacterium]|nr:hypothetical protein [Candidatus Hydrogenedentota bacterium]